MTEHDLDRDFWANIVAEPLDDTPRLVWSDYLDETATTVECPRCGGGGQLYDGPGGGQRAARGCGHCGGDKEVPDGRAALAAVVRLGVDLAEWPCACDDESERVYHDECRCKERGQKSQEYARLFDAAAGALPAFAGLPLGHFPTRAALLYDKSNWHRGLPARVTLTAAEFLRSVDELRAAVPLERATLTTELGWDFLHRDGKTPFLYAAGRPVVASEVRECPRLAGHHALRNARLFADGRKALRRILGLEFPGLEVAFDLRREDPSSTSTRRVFHDEAP